MMEKQNRTVEKDAAGDAGVLDDIVDSAAARMALGRAKRAPEGDGPEKRDRRA